MSTYIGASDPASNLRDQARATMAAKLLSDWVKTHANDARTTTHTLMNDTGSEKIRVSDDQGTDLGTITLTKGRTSAHVSDQAAFLEWVMQRYPQHVHITPTIDPSWLERTLNTATKLGTPVDTETGELIPGLTINTSEPYLTTRPSMEARERMHALIEESGLLALTTPKEIH